MRDEIGRGECPVKVRQAVLGLLACVISVAGCSGFNATSPTELGTAPAVATPGVPSANAPSSTQGAGGPPLATPIHAYHLGLRGGTAFFGGSVWMAGGGTLLRIDPISGAPVATIKIDGAAKFVFVGAGSIWVSRASASQYEPSSTVRVSPVTNRVTGTVPFGVAFGFGSTWAMNGDGWLLRGDPITGRTVGSVKIQAPFNWGPQIAIGFGSVWVASGDERTLFRVDPGAMRITASIGPLYTTDSLLSLGVGFGSVWADVNAAGAGGGPGPGLLYRIDPGSSRVIASIPLGSQQPSSGYGATVVGIGEGSVWTGDSDSTISRVDPATDTVVAVRSDISSHEFIAAGFGSVWADDERFDAADWAP
jgi:hypothetical protein